VKADAVVQTARRRADQVVRTARDAVDREEGPQSTTSAAGSAHARTVLEDERSSADALLARERAARKLERARSLSVERASTNIDLTGERSRADTVLLDQREANEQLIAATLRAHELADEAEASRESAEASERELRVVAEFREMFIGVLAHDLRNPLGSIVMQADLLRQAQTQPEAQPERRLKKSADSIERSATRMERLIQDLLGAVVLQRDAVTVSADHDPLLRTTTASSAAPPSTSRTSPGAPSLEPAPRRAERLHPAQDRRGAAGGEDHAAAGGASREDEGQGSGQHRGGDHRRPPFLVDPPGQPVDQQQEGDPGQGGGEPGRELALSQEAKGDRHGPAWEDRPVQEGLPVQAGHEPVAPLRHLPRRFGEGRLVGLGEPPTAQGGEEKDRRGREEEGQGRSSSLHGRFLSFGVPGQRPGGART